MSLSYRFGAEVDIGCLKVQPVARVNPKKSAEAGGPVGGDGTSGGQDFTQAALDGFLRAGLLKTRFLSRRRSAVSTRCTVQVKARPIQALDCQELALLGVKCANLFAKTLCPNVGRWEWTSIFCLPTRGFVT